MWQARMKGAFENLMLAKMMTSEFYVNQVDAIKPIGRMVPSHPDCTTVGACSILLTLSAVFTTGLWRTAGKIPSLWLFLAIIQGTGEVI